MRMSMTKQAVLGTGIDLKQFFEASVDALQYDGESPDTGSRAIRQNGALVQRNRMNGTPEKRALADAARALTALWRT
jgi:hypothetical protein